MNKIAIIEDSGVMEFMWKKIFEGSEFQVGFVNSKPAEFMKLRELNPDIIFCPGVPKHLEGIELGAKIKSDSVLKSKSLVVTTSLSEDTLTKGVMGWDPLMVDSILVKPFTREQVFNLLGQLSEKSSIPKREKPLSLIIDDTALARTLLKKEMEVLGFSVETASNGEDGVELAKKLLPDIILTDVEMPGISGYQVCEKLSDNGSTRQIPVLVISGSISDSEVRKAFNSGAIDFIAKPVDSKKLAVSVASLVGRKQQEASGTALVFEEDPRVGSIIVKLLSETGLRPQVCTTLADTEGSLTISTPDILVLDISRQKEKGREICLQLRKNPALKFTSLIVISEMTDTEYLVECLKAGANDFMVKPFTKEEFSARVEIHLRTKQLQDELGQKVKMMETLAYCDTLTGLMNRRFLEESLKREIQKAKENNQPLGVIMMDLDHFKKKNDTYGHAVGDILIAGVAGIIKDSVKMSGFSCRYGGEEFCILLPKAGIEQAKMIAEKIRSGSDKKKWQQEIIQTVSLGISVFPNSSTEETVVSDADAALYVSKETGRNRFTVFEPGMGKKK